MKKPAEQFLHELQHTAKRQSRLQDTSFFPRFLYPLTSFIGEKPWQTLAFSSFLFSMIIFLLWFEFFYNFVHNIL
jgi:hypothetical protein